MELTEIIELCKQNNRKAQNKLFESYYSQLFHTAMRMLFNQHDAEDVLSISFNKIFRGLENFEYRDKMSLDKWMRTIVINETIRFVNQRKTIELYEDISDIPSQEISENVLFDNKNIDTELVYAIIENMPSGYRLIFNLFAIEGYAHSEIAEMMNISESTSKSQLYKARQHIINRLNNK